MFSSILPHVVLDSISITSTFQGARICSSSITFPPGGPIPGSKVTLLFMNVSVSSSTSEADIGATKSSGLRHLRIMTSHSSVRERVGELSAGLTGMVWDW